VPPTKRKFTRRGRSTGLPTKATHPRHVWSWDFIAHALQAWLARESIKTIYIEPASPWQNGFVESFYGRFREPGSSLRTSA
jgi:transposase InsO family protein